LWTAKYTSEAQSVLTLPTSKKQFELILDKSSRTEGSGGRGSGKSEGGILKAIKKMLEEPGTSGEVVSPVFKLTKITWHKLFAIIPFSWLLSGSMGIRRSDRELTFVNGSEVRFMSADNPDSLRSWGGHWAFVDEEQDVSTEAIDIIWPSLRLSSKPQLWSVGTPKKGDYLERHKQLLQDDNSTKITFDSYSNPFVSHKVFELAQKQMDEKRYRQEILADWTSVMTEDLPLIFPSFDKEQHTINWPIVIGKDITRDVTRQRTGFARDWIAGVDYNWDWPNVCCLSKVYYPDKWVAVHCISSKGHAGHLGQALKQKGFKPESVLVIDDASGQYNRGKNSRNSSSRLMRAEGFTVVHPTKNPSIIDSVNAILAKMTPVDADPTMFCVTPNCTELVDSFEQIMWDKSGVKFDKTTGVDHWIDAFKYPLSYFYPAAKIPSRIQGIMAR
jgi:phage terminase large subunit